eukprot:c22195_g2_i2 orf=132-1529(+)
MAWGDLTDSGGRGATTMQESGECESSLSEEATRGGGWERFLPGHRLRVLLVEGDRATRRLVSSLLSKCGYEVTASSNCAKAWNRLEHSDTKFDLVLADAMLPFLSGNDLLTKITSSEVHKDIPVIMMSSQDSIEVVFKCLLRGAKDFLVKPLRRNELQNLWQHVWRKYPVSSKTGGESDVEGKKRKAESISCSGDMSSDNFSLSSGMHDSNSCEGRSATQVLQQDSKVGLSQENEKTSYKVPDEQDNLSRAITTRARDPRSSGKGLDLSCENPLGDSPHCQPLPAMEYPLRKESLTSTAWRDLYVNGGVYQAPFSAFSKFSTSPLPPPPQQGISRSNIFPSEQCSLSGSAGGSTVVNGNGDRTHMAVCVKAHKMAVSTRSCGSSTLHSPCAANFQHGKLVGNATLPSSTSCCDESSKHTAEKNSLCSARISSLNSSCANASLLPKETSVLDTDQINNHTTAGQLL